MTSNMLLVAAGCLASAAMGLAPATLLTMRPGELRTRFGWAPIGVPPKNEDKGLKVWNALRKGYNPLESSEGIPEIIPPVSYWREARAPSRAAQHLLRFGPRQVLREQLRSIQNEKDMASRKLQKQEAATAASDKYLIQAKKLEAKIVELKR